VDEEAAASANPLRQQAESPSAFENPLRLQASPPPVLFTPTSAASPARLPGEVWLSEKVTGPPRTADSKPSIQPLPPVTQATGILVPVPPEMPSLGETQALWQQILVVSPSADVIRCTIIDSNVDTIKVHYNGFDNQFDEWLLRSSERIKDFVAGDSVVVLATFESNSEPVQQLRAGLTGVIKKLDADGDANITFTPTDGAKFNTWIYQDNFHRLGKLHKASLLSVGDTVRAIWAGDGKWYDAMIVQVNADDTMSVIWMDGTATFRTVTHSQVCKFVVGDSVTVMLRFLSASEPPWELNPGDTGVVRRFDADGDVNITFVNADGSKFNEWIFQAHFDMLRKLERGFQQQAFEHTLELGDTARSPSVEEISERPKSSRTANSSFHDGFPGYEQVSPSRFPLSPQSAEVLTLPPFPLSPQSLNASFVEVPEEC